jgi:hypothetical protein
LQPSLCIFARYARRPQHRESLVRFSGQRLALKTLPIGLPIPIGPVGIVTLKNRTLNPVTRLFIEAAREVVGTMRQ